MDKGSPADNGLPGNLNATLFAMSRTADDTPPSLDIAERVQDFYDRYPYPPPVDSLEQYRLHWQDLQKRRADYHLFWPDSPYREDYSILIAGCGTSQAAEHAMRRPVARVTGIDMSTTSVRCTEELKRKYNLTNLQVHQLPIDRISELGETFDQIVCTGVLHHLADPDAGLATLRAVLKPDGAMHLMVYASLRTAASICCRNFVGGLGRGQPMKGSRSSSLRWGRSRQAIRWKICCARPRIFGRGQHLPMPCCIRKIVRLRWPQLFDFIARGGLIFGRWVKQAPYSPRCGVMAQIPQASRMAHLPLAEQVLQLRNFSAGRWFGTA